MSRRWRLFWEEFGYALYEGHTVRRAFAYGFAALCREWRHKPSKLTPIDQTLSDLVTVTLLNRTPKMQEAITRNNPLLQRMMEKP